MTFNYIKILNTNISAFPASISSAFLHLNYLVDFLCFNTIKQLIHAYSSANLFVNSVQLINSDLTN